ncbi:MAG TPA: MMPL family transporter [Actinomycetota bacterium]|nr:MMPL family transporter [Actinomycetota bacterium]
MLERLASWSYRRRWPMLGLWVAGLILANVLGTTAGGEYSNDFSLPGAESQEAYDLLRERFPSESGDSAQVVFRAEDGVADPQVQEAIESLLADLGEVDHVAAVESPYAPGGERNVSPEGDIAYADVQFDIEATAVTIELVDEMKALAREAEGPGLQIALGGPIIAFNEFEEPGGSEMIGLLAAILILLVTFGSVLAMGLPIITALFGIGIGLALVTIFANFLSVPDFTPQLASMIGIGVGIDYALFIVTRFRQHLQQGMDPESATVRAITTSGRAVLFAGTTVVISLLGILLMGFAFVQGVAIGGAATVLVTMIASVTLLPAILGFTGRNVDKWKLPKLHRAETRHQGSMWFRWSRVIQRRPVPAALAAFAVLITLTIPLFGIRLGQADAGTAPETRDSRQAYDLLSEGFGPGFNGPLILAARLSGPDAIADLETLTAEIVATDGVAAATPPFPNEAGDAAVITVFPETSPQDPETNHLVHALRDEVVPEFTAGTDTEVFVGGATASVIDFSEKNGERLPILIGAVITLSFLLLVVVFRSILVPLKAAVMNLLSIGAAYGVIVAIFQWGWLKDVFGVASTAPIEAWVPMMLFTILFGLSMDYEIFLLSRIREEYLVSRDNGLAVANGLATTARVITAAAAIMVTVFLSFVFGFDERSIKLFGLGLAVAIFVDATIVRMVLVPATMELLGDANWWFPKWLDRLVPRIAVEGEGEHLDASDLDREAAELEKKEKPLSV